MRAAGDDTPAIGRSTRLVPKVAERRSALGLVVDDRLFADGLIVHARSLAGAVLPLGFALCFANLALALQLLALALRD